MHIIIIDKKDSSKRLDKFLSELSKVSKEFSEFSRGDFSREIKAGKVMVNKSKVKPSYRLCEDDEIKLKIKKAVNLNKLIVNSEIEFETIFEDENIIVVNKPADLQVHPDHNEKSATLLNGLISKYPEILNIKEENSNFPNLRPGIVHRLDKDTSGILIIARNQKTFIELKEMFQKRKIQKKYLAIVYGTPEEKTGIIDKPLARTSNYRRQTIAGQKTKTKIREATTNYKLIKKLDQNLSLLEVSPQTGRTHQVRVHLFSIGHPLIGDKLYKSKIIKKLSSVPRHMLHASEIKFKLFGKAYEFSAKPPKDFNSFKTTELTL